MPQSGIGAATSYELGQDIKEWESTAAIAWSVNGRNKVDALAIDRAIRKEFRLSHRDLAVCPHQPVQFLLKFEQKAHCSKVLKKGRVKVNGAHVQIRPWRPLEHAFGAAMTPLDMPLPSLQFEPLQLQLAPHPASASMSITELRAVLAEHAAELQAELMECLDGALQPILAETAAVRSWNARAAALMDMAATTASPHPRQSPSPASLHVIIQVDKEGTHRSARVNDSPISVGPGLGAQGSPLPFQLTRPTCLFDGPEGGEHDWPEELAPGKEAWHDDTLTSGSPTAPAPSTEAPAEPDRALDAATSAAPAPDGNAATEADTLQQFIHSVAKPVQLPLINMPPIKKKKATKVSQPSPRRSGRIATKKRARQLSDGAEAIQELIARVCGILAPAASFDDASRAAYRQMFVQSPLIASAIQALDALVKQVKKLKKQGTNKAKGANVKIAVDV